MRRIQWKGISGSIFVTLACLLAVVTTAAGDPPKKIAILPFEMHVPDNLAYLGDGIYDMLSSRLSWKGTIQVVGKDTVRKGAPAALKDPSIEKARAAGQILGLDYVLLGSVTALGNSVSVDTRMVPTIAGGEVQTFHVQTSNLDELIPKIDEMAQQINEGVFSRTATVAATSSAPTQEAPASWRSPEALIPKLMKSGHSMSYINPNFIEVTPERAFNREGLWRSQVFSEGIQSMDAGDVDGDGRDELVTVSNRSVKVYRREEAGLKMLASLQGSVNDSFIWVCLYDVDGDDTKEICVTNLHRFIEVSRGAPESAKGGSHDTRKPSSLVLKLKGSKLEALCDEQPYYLNALDLVQADGVALIGQKRDKEELFDPTVYIMQYTGSALTPMRAISLPKQCNVFNFVQGDITNDHVEEVVVVHNDQQLGIYTLGGDKIWYDSNVYAATSVKLEGKIEDQRYNMIEFYYMPSPILVTDINNDRIREVIVARYPHQVGFLPEGMKIYETAEIVSLSWVPTGMIENWKTHTISGMVTCVRKGDLNNDGVEEMLVSVIMGSFMRLWESKSVVLSYDLNVGQAPEEGAQTAQQGEQQAGS